MRHFMIFTPALCLVALLTVLPSAGVPQSMRQQRDLLNADLEARQRRLAMMADRTRLRDYQFTRLMWQPGIMVRGCASSFDMLGLPKGVGRVMTVGQDAGISRGDVCRFLPEDQFLATRLDVTPPSGKYSFAYEKTWQSHDVSLQFEGTNITGFYSYVVQHAWDTRRLFDDIHDHRFRGQATKCYTGTSRACYMVVVEETVRSRDRTRPGGGPYRLFLAFENAGNGRWTGTGRRAWIGTSDGQTTGVSANFIP